MKLFKYSKFYIQVELDIIKRSGFFLFIVLTEKEKKMISYRRLIKLIFYYLMI